MTNQQLVYLTSYIEQHYNLAVMFAYYYQDQRKVRIILYYAFPQLGTGYVQYPVEY